MGSLNHFSTAWQCISTRALVHVHCGQQDPLDHVSDMDSETEQELLCNQGQMAAVDFNF